MSSGLKLHHSAASSNSRRVRIFLAEKGIASLLHRLILPRASNTLMPTSRSIRDASSPNSFWTMALRSERFRQFGAISKRSNFRPPHRPRPRATALRQKRSFHNRSLCEQVSN
jgi:hypothetical protein